uniref:Uncharacterized protein n=1 Tax=Arundo donax TaxID=35708 RepID=A0A0A9HFS1_ARUDO
MRLSKFFVYTLIYWLGSVVSLLVDNAVHQQLRKRHQQVPVLS